MKGIFLSPRKPLFIFAHRQEAFYFLQDKKILKITEDCFEYDDYFLLLTGEGLVASLFYTTQILEKINSQILFVCNFGICGLIDESRKDLSIEKTVYIRTVYAEKKFHSFSSLDKSDSCDVISAAERVKDLESSKKLSCFAPIVDRELWGIAYACQKYSIPWRSIKVISDTPEMACKVVTEQADKWGKMLWWEWRENFRAINLNKKKSRELGKEFHVTESQNYQLRKLFEYLERRKDSGLELELEDYKSELLLNQNQKPKDKTKKLIEFLSKKLEPRLYV